MSVAMAMTMDSGYGMRLGGVGSHRHRVCRSPSSELLMKKNNRHLKIDERGKVEVEVEEEEEEYEDEEKEIIRNNDNEIRESPLRFSVLNILKPDFGREAILKSYTKINVKQISTRSQQHHHSPITLPRDLTVTSTSNGSSGNCTRLLSSLDRNNSSTSSNCLQPHHNTGLSRSGSLESLASNRSSLTGSSIAGTPSLSSGASSIGTESINGETQHSSQNSSSSNNSQTLWPAWVYCTRYSDRPSSGPRTRRVKRSSGGENKSISPEEKRPRTAFSAEQLARLKQEFTENRYLTERRRQQLSRDLGLNEAQIKIWFQNKRAKIKKSTGQKNPLALQLMAQGLYNHSTVPIDDDGEELVSLDGN